MNSDGDERARRIPEIIRAIHAQIKISRDLCEESANLRQQNAELREFLQETLLTTMSRRDRRTDR